MAWKELAEGRSRLTGDIGQEGWGLQLRCGRRQERPRYGTTWSRIGGFHSIFLASLFSYHLHVISLESPHVLLPSSLQFQFHLWFPGWGERVKVGKIGSCKVRAWRLGGVADRSAFLFRPPVALELIRLVSFLLQPRHLGDSDRRDVCGITRAALDNKVSPRLSSGRRCWPRRLPKYLGQSMQMHARERDSYGETSFHMSNLRQSDFAWSPENCLRRLSLTQHRRCKQ